MHATTSHPSFTPTLTKKGPPGSRMTAIENLAISLVYRTMGESRYNRTAQEYADIAARLKPLKPLHDDVNEELRRFLASREKRPEFCRWESGHDRIVIETYPDKISTETLRRALVLHGFRKPGRPRGVSC